MRNLFEMTAMIGKGVFGLLKVIANIILVLLGAGVVGLYLSHPFRTHKTTIMLASLADMNPPLTILLVIGGIIGFFYIVALFSVKP